MEAEKNTIVSEKMDDKEPYTSPEFSTYGSLEELTQDFSNCRSPGADASSGRKKKKKKKKKQKKSKKHS